VDLQLPPGKRQTNGLHHFSGAGHFICAAWINKTQNGKGMERKSWRRELENHQIGGSWFVMRHASPHFLIDFKMFQFG